MTVYPSHGTWSLPPPTAARSDVGWPPRQDAESPDALVDVTVALRRCAMHRKAFRGAAINFPAGLLSHDPVARWIRRHGVGVDVTTDDELDQAVSAGISPLHIVMHRADGFAAPARFAVNAGVGKFVVNSGQQIAMLAGCGPPPQRVLLDVTNESAEVLATDVMARQRLCLIGLHCRLGDTDHDSVEDIVQEMIAQMSWVRREFEVILTRVSLGEFDAAELSCDRNDLRGISDALEEAVEDSCARYRYPRPALVLSLRHSAVNPSR